MTTEAEILKIIDERDAWEREATELAEAVGRYFRFEVGEHSNMNCPVQNAIAFLDVPLAWTKDPPSDAGWYWWRKGMEPRPMKVWWQADHLVGSTRPMPMNVRFMGGEWWSAKLFEPK